MKHHIPTSEVIWSSLGLSREQYAAQYARELAFWNSGSVHAPSDYRPQALLEQDDLYTSSEINAFAMSRVTETATRMVARYSSSRVASDMAHYHACDYPRDSREAIYWRAVSHRISAESIQ